MTTKSKALLIGLLSALFFAVTFVLNRSMALSGGSWLWTASFRYYWMLLLLLPLLYMRGELRPLLRVMSQNVGAWLGWSAVGFGIFYGGLTYASSFAPGWLVASTWQITIIAGVCISPFLGGRQDKLSIKTILFTLLILLGIFLLQIPQAQAVSGTTLIQGIIPIVLAAFAYPLGNRKMMILIDGKLNAIQRLCGMTLASMPCWLLLSAYGLSAAEAPTAGMLIQTFLIALFSGVIATWLFFKATDLVRKDEKSLAAVEATQSTEVIFALAGEVLILQAALPDSLSLLGIGIVIVGMALHSLQS